MQIFRCANWFLPNIFWCFVPYRRPLHPVFANPNDKLGEVTSTNSREYSNKVDKQSNLLPPKYLLNFDFSFSLCIKFGFCFWPAFALIGVGFLLNLPWFFCDLGFIFHKNYIQNTTTRAILYVKQLMKIYNLSLPTLTTWAKRPPNRLTALLFDNFSANILERNSTAIVNIFNYSTLITMSLASIKQKELKGKKNVLPKLRTILANPYKQHWWAARDK